MSIIVAMVIEDDVIQEYCDRCCLRGHVLKTISLGSVLSTKDEEMSCSSFVTMSLMLHLAIASLRLFSAPIPRMVVFDTIAHFIMLSQVQAS